MQVRAIFEAAAQVRGQGGDPKVEVMIPLVATAPELRQMREELEPVAEESLGDTELSHLEWGTMVELPRAAVTAGEIAETAEFFSFGTIDIDGVGRLMRIAADEGRAANASLHLGICGEHGGDPASVVFCHQIGLDYVSCSPFRVETARLAAGQAAVGAAESASK
jgi:pyruvate,orthophosphate dikinase